MEWWFGIAIVLSWFGVGALLTYLYNAGKSDILGRFPSISAVVGLFSNTLYFVALSKILRTVSCSSFPGYGLVFRYPLAAGSLDVFELECWGSEHRGIVYLSIITTVFFALSLTLISPFFVEDLTGRKMTPARAHIKEGGGGSSPSPSPSSSSSSPNTYVHAHQAPSSSSTRLTRNVTASPKQSLSSSR